MIPYYNSQLYYGLSKRPYASHSCPCTSGTDQHTEAHVCNIIWYCLLCNSAGGVEEKSKDKGTRTKWRPLKYIN